MGWEVYILSKFTCLPTRHFVLADQLFPSPSRSSDVRKTSVSSWGIRLMLVHERSPNEKTSASTPKHFISDSSSPEQLQLIQECLLDIWELNLNVADCQRDREKRDLLLRSSTLADSSGEDQMRTFWSRILVLIQFAAASAVDRIWTSSSCPEEWISSSSLADSCVSPPISLPSLPWLPQNGLSQIS